MIQFPWKECELGSGEYRKLVDEEQTPVMPNEMENLVKEVRADPEIVALFQNINEAGPLPSR